MRFSRKSLVIATQASLTAFPRIRVEPLAMTEVNGGKVRVRVRQLVKSLDGDVLSDSDVCHVFTMHGGLIAAMHLGNEGESSDGATAAFAKQS